MRTKPQKAGAATLSTKTLFSEISLFWELQKCPNTELFLASIFQHSDWLLYFPVLRVYSVNLRIQSEYRKIWTRNNSVFGHFSSSNICRLFYVLAKYLVETSEIGIEWHHKKVNVTVISACKRPNRSLKN